LSVITSVVARPNRNNEKGGKSKDRPRTRKMDETKKKGIKILMIKRTPMKNGLNTVVNRNTDWRENEAREATLPVPKKATLIKKRKKMAGLASLGPKPRVG